MKDGVLLQQQQQQSVQSNIKAGRQKQQIDMIDRICIQQPYTYLDRIELIELQTRLDLENKRIGRVC